MMMENKNMVRKEKGDAKEIALFTLSFDERAQSSARIFHLPITASN